MVNTTTLQEVHLILQELSAGRRCNLSINSVSEKLKEHAEPVKTKLEQLSYLDYVHFSACGNFVRLTDTGILAEPIIRAAVYRCDLNHPLNS